MRINERIRAKQVRLIDQDNNQVGVVEKYIALGQARDVGLDLVEVSPNADPPVCRIMDYGKYLYQQKRKQREAHKKSQHHAGTIKEIRFKPETDQHDLEIKIKHGIEFLEKGYKVQFSVFFRGRQMLHKDVGYEMLEQIQQRLAELARVERPPQMAGRRMTMMLIPAKH